MKNRQNLKHSQKARELFPSLFDYALPSFYENSHRLESAIRQRKNSREWKLYIIQEFN